MLTIKELIGIIVGNEIEPMVTVTSGNDTVAGMVVDYGDDAIMLASEYAEAGVAYYIFPYANINSIYRYVSNSKEV